MPRLGSRKYDHSPELLERARALYEDKRVKLERVREILGVHSGYVVYHIAHREGWIRGKRGRVTPYNREQLEAAEALWEKGAPIAEIAVVLNLKGPPQGVYTIARTNDWKYRNGERRGLKASRLRALVRKDLAANMPKPGRRPNTQTVRRRVAPMTSFGRCARCGFRASDDPEYSVRLGNGDLVHRKCQEGRAA
jgi:hypothetical protein